MIKNIIIVYATVDLGLLKEGHVLGPRINRTTYFLDLEYLFDETHFMNFEELYMLWSFQASSRGITFGAFLSTYPWVFMKNRFVC